MRKTYAPNAIIIGILIGLLVAIKGQYGSGDYCRSGCLRPRLGFN